ncbi:efflux transporter outer membrane subunit [Paraburkholderia sp. BL25I1N1]|uniref:efflux transporter outer membrane subunit n=1 Tax=Paraburkholderia sp. BL25I1N1 TaxID=1938804 RepID=UPI000D44ED99|nr:efflux transporter outer membrane subunit [Paraburkholderia sp. BL25I1N1]PRY05992.1 NodT family efflux transporter outer membrane factor (OMF) lipoprotein [Paraburkholderia sp. BL25I1N1]
MKSWVMTAFGLASLTACTVGPNYNVPAKATAVDPLARAPFVGAASNTVVSAPLPDHWWKLYDDARLDDLIREGLAANRDLGAAQENLARATYAVYEAESANLPSTALSGAVAVSTPPLPRAAGMPLRGVYSLGGAISYALDLAGGIRREVEAAKAGRDTLQAARDQVRMVVAAGITRDYIAACSANQTLASAQHVLDVETQTLRATERLRQGGRATAFDVTRARAAVATSGAALPPIVAQRNAAVFALTALLGRVPAQYPREVQACLAPPRLLAEIPVGDGAALIRRRPDIREAERKLAAATALIGVETAALYPQVSLGGSIGMSGPTSKFSNKSQISMSFGPIVTWTFPNVVATRARIAEAGATARAAEQTFDGAVIEALRDTETALDAYSGELQHNGSLVAARDTASEANEQAWRLFRFGRTDFLSVLSAQENLASAESSLAASNASLIDRQIGVFIALGGGWEDSASPQMSPPGADNIEQPSDVRPSP